MEDPGDQNKQVNLHQDLVDKINLRAIRTRHRKISQLNDDCIVLVLALLSFRERIRIEKVCKRWKILARLSWRKTRKLYKNNDMWGVDLATKSPSRVAEIFYQVLDRCGHYVTRVDFTDFDVNRVCLNQVVQMCPNLRYLDAGNLTLTSLVSRAIGNNCRNLRELSIGPSSEICRDRHLKRLFQRCQRIRYFKMSNNLTLTGQSFESLPNHTMEVLILINCPNVSSQLLCSAFHRFEKLETFIIDNSDVDIAIRRMVRPRIYQLPPTLKVLKIVHVNHIYMDIVTMLEHLERLDIPGSNINDDFLLNLAITCKRLISLNINNCTRITNTGIMDLIHIPKLEELSIRHMNLITDEPFKYVKTLRKLFCINCENVRDPGLCTLVERCDRLDTLDVTRCRNVTQALLDHAVIVTSRRTNGIILDLNLRGTFVFDHGEEIHSRYISVQFSTPDDLEAEDSETTEDENDPVVPIPGPAGPAVDPIAPGVGPARGPINPEEDD